MSYDEIIYRSVSDNRVIGKNVCDVRVSLRGKAANIDRVIGKSVSDDRIIDW